MRRIEQLTYSLIFICFLMAILFYPILPAEIASHWDPRDTPDRFVSKEVGLFIIPLASLLLVLIFRIVPNLDPYEDSMKKLKPYYDECLFVLIAFFFYIHFVMIIWNSGIRFYILQLVAPAFGILLYYFGDIMTVTKRNHLIGVATPWALHDEKLWKKTHEFAGKIFKIAGLVAILGFFFKTQALYFMITPLILAVVYTYIYSYTEYKKLHTHTKKGSK